MQSFITGSQTEAHKLRMFKESIKFILKIWLTSIILSLTIYFYTVDTYTLKLVGYYYQAKLLQETRFFGDTLQAIDPNGKSVIVTTTKVLQASFVHTAVNEVYLGIKRAVKYSTGILPLIPIYLFFQGRRKSGKKILRGGMEVKPSKLRSLVFKYNNKILRRRLWKIVGLLQDSHQTILAKLLNIIGLTTISTKLKRTIDERKLSYTYIPYKLPGNIEYPSRTETQHTLITGGSGTGKTQIIKNLIQQIKQNGDRAIIYDKMGSVIPFFYKKNKDIILNPFDKRSPAWSIFNEAKEDACFDSIASALIPIEKNTNDPFWTNAARTIFTQIAIKLKEQGETINKKLVDTLLKSDFTEIAQMVKGTSASSIIDEKSPKTAISVMSVLSTYLRSLRYLKDADNKVDTNTPNKPFSIRNWVMGEQNNQASFTNNEIRNVNEGSLLFISSRGDQHESLKPLISTWLEIAVNSLLSLNQDRNRRIWIILDELPSLHILPSLNSGLAESRQFGGCFVLSVQSFAQLRDIYGREKAESISGLTATKLVLKTPDPDTARWCSDSLGKKETEEVKEGISYGAHEMRDGVSLNKQKTMEDLVIPTQIMNLPNLECYIKLASDFPISKAKVRVNEAEQIAEKFVTADDTVTSTSTTTTAIDNKKTEEWEKDGDITTASIVEESQETETSEKVQEEQKQLQNQLEQTKLEIDQKTGEVVNYQQLQGEPTHKASKKDNEEDLKLEDAHTSKLKIVPMNEEPMVKETGPFKEKKVRGKNPKAQKPINIKEDLQEPQNKPRKRYEYKLDE